jgi:hypothetical protein
MKASAIWLGSFYLAEGLANVLNGPGSAADQGHWDAGGLPDRRTSERFLFRHLHLPVVQAILNFEKISIGLKG